MQLPIHTPENCSLTFHNIERLQASMTESSGKLNEHDLLKFRGVEKLVEHRHSNHHFYPRIEPRTNQLVFGCELCSGQFATAPVATAHFCEKHLNSQRADILPPTTSNRTARSASKGRGGQHQTSTRPREFLCDVCGKCYTQSSHLWQHLRFHRGVKPFACNVEGCDRRFTIRPDLNDHIRKCHTGERPYLCTICDKRFLTGSVYYQHRLIHHGERRYGCSECSKRFYRADALKNHERMSCAEFHSVILSRNQKALKNKI